MGNFDWFLVSPVICLAAFGLLTMVLVPIVRGHSRLLAIPTYFGLAVTGFSLMRLWSQWMATGPQETAFGLVRIDGFGLFFSFLLLGITALSVMLSVNFLERESADQGEFYALMLFCLAGMFVMLHTTHLMVVLIGTLPFEEVDRKHDGERGDAEQ